MKDYSTFNPEDFAQDDAFLKWVKHSDRYPLLDQFWKQWLTENPDKKEEIEEARLMILAISFEKKHKPVDGKQLEIWKRINKTINDSHTANNSPLAYSTASLWKPWYNKAAAILMVISIGFYSWYSREGASVITENTVAPELLLEKQVNNSSHPKTIILSDETSIVLQPGSTLEYPAIFDEDMRVVYLTGEAFFEVKKDSNRPFLVHADEIITRVIGTSFTIRNYSGEKKVLVRVKTGKVSVFKDKQRDASKTGKDETIEGIVLMPNQQVVYEREEMKMIKSLVENPSVLAPVSRQEFEFNETPIKEVFSAIEQAYGVEIVYDEEAMSSCYLNASLANVPLHDKLKLICKAINTTYEIIDSHIVIYGKGCDQLN